MQFLNVLIGVLGDICDENNYHSTNTTLNKAQLFKMSRFGVGAWILLTAPQTEIRILWRVKNTLFLNALNVLFCRQKYPQIFTNNDNNVKDQGTLVLGGMSEISVLIKAANAIFFCLVPDLVLCLVLPL